MLVTFRENGAREKAMSLQPIPPSPPPARAARARATAQTEITRQVTVAPGAFGSSFIPPLYRRLRTAITAPPTSGRHEPWRRRARQFLGRSGGRQTREWDKRRTQTLGEGASPLGSRCSAGGGCSPALTQLGMAGAAERDQVPLDIAAGFAAADEAVMLQISGEPHGR